MWCLDDSEDDSYGDHEEERAEGGAADVEPAVATQPAIEEGGEAGGGLVVPPRGGLFQLDDESDSSEDVANDDAPPPSCPPPTDSRPLKVRCCEDALKYLDQVKSACDLSTKIKLVVIMNELYNEFKGRTVNTPYRYALIENVCTLFHGHRDLILGFNRFLPPGYEMKVQPGDAEQRVYAPSPTPSSCLPLADSSAGVPSAAAESRLVEGGSSSNGLNPISAAIFTPSPMQARAPQPALQQTLAMHPGAVPISLPGHRPVLAPFSMLSPASPWQRTKGSGSTGYGTFVNVILPPLIDAAGRQGPKSKFEAVAAEICEECMHGAYDDCGEDGTTVRDWAVQVYAFLMRRQRQREQGESLYLRPDQKGFVEQLAKPDPKPNPNPNPHPDSGLNANPNPNPGWSSSWRRRCCAAARPRDW